jgi:hypothetical protein
MATPAWQVTSNTSKSLAAAVGSLAVGLLFIWLTRHARAGDTNAVAAMWLGVMLAAVGLAGLIFSEEIVVTVETAQRRLRIECRRRWGNVAVSVPFDDVGSVNVVRVGSRSDGTPTFWLQIERRDGKTFGTGRWSTKEAEMGRLAERLAAEIGCECQNGNPAGPASVGHVAVSVLVAVALYAGWFRVSVGPWCEAMWYGTAPAVFILAMFAVVLGLVRRFWV